MKYITSKSQYRRVLIKFLNEFVGDLIVDKLNKGEHNVNVITSNGDDIATLWIGGPITKGCKRELSLDKEFTNDFESFIPINKQKIFSEVILEYFYLKTGIKCDCIEYNYFTGKYKDYERFDDNGGKLIVSDKEYDYYGYKIPKKQ